MKVNSEKERLICYSAGILQAKLSNSITTQFSSPETLMRSSIKLAQLLIDTIYDDDKLNEVLKP